VNVSTCPQCGGAGQVVRERCRECKGEGRLSESDTIAVKVPRGVASGNFIPLRGMGDAGPRGGPAGDLIVLIEEKAHAVFVRDGDDLHVDLPVGFATVALGGKVEAPLIDGTRAALNVAPGTPTGHVLRLRGKGLPSLRGGSGDLLVRLIVWVPTRVSGEERRLLEQLAHSEGLKPPAPARSLFERVRDTFGG
jgi:molecular chaperone DnaJ